MNVTYTSNLTLIDYNNSYFLPYHAQMRFTNTSTEKKVHCMNFT